MSTASDIWENHQELYPIPVVDVPETADRNASELRFSDWELKSEWGFEDTTSREYVTPCYAGLGGRCVIWMYDYETSKDYFGVGVNYPSKFTVNYNPIVEEFRLDNGTRGYEGTRTVDLHSWEDVLWLIEEIGQNLIAGFTLRKR